MGRVRSFFTEWQARRRGRHALSRDFQKATRHIIGPTGFQRSTAWSQLEQEDGSYLKSFDPRIPPSIHISSPDLTSANMPVPLVERCIEDRNDQHARKAPRTQLTDRSLTRVPKVWHRHIHVYQYDRILTER